jgi:dihydropteroate synthase
VHATPVRTLAGLPDPGRTLVMGVLNVTPDSFSDGGRYLDSNDAVRHGREMTESGADLVDVGGESTRPGADRPSIDRELERVIPVIEQLAAAGVVVSIDTMRAEVARQAVGAGARLVNDVSGGLADATMLATIADLGVPCVLMHWRAHSASMADFARYDDVVTEVIAELGDRVVAAERAGIQPGRVAVDPGIGFAKKPDHNWTLMASLERLHELGRPVVLGTSRKRFLGELLGDAEGGQRPPDQRDDATAATTVLAVAAGIWCVRVHDPRSSADAVRVAARVAEEAADER